MDSITQGVLGAAIGELMLGKKIGNKGALLGAAIATIPDLDVILYLFYSKLEMLSIHRGLSHSIAFSIVGSILIAFVLSRIKWTKEIKLSNLLLFSWLCLFTHIMLDTFTAYGTQLFLPFSNRRLGFDSINVVDPVYTIPMIVGLLFSLWLFRSSSKRSSFNTIGLIISTIYLSFTLINKEMVDKDVAKRLSSENIEYQALMTMPVGVANINWYGLAKGQDSIYLFEHSVLKKEHNPLEVFPIHEEYLDEIDADVAEIMRWFAKGFYTVDKVDEKIRVYNLQVDMRGVINNGHKKAPTAGYFELSKTNGRTELTSGTIMIH